MGASTNPARPVYGVMAYMLRAGYHVIPVNPGQAGREILGQKVYARLADIPELVDVVDISAGRRRWPASLTRPRAAGAAEGDLDAA